MILSLASVCRRRAVAYDLLAPRRGMATGEMNLRGEARGRAHHCHAAGWPGSPRQGEEQSEAGAGRVPERVSRRSRVTET